MSAADPRLSYCQSHYQHLLDWAFLFIKLSWWAALVVIAGASVAAAVKWALALRNPTRNIADSANGSAILDSLKGLIDSLKTAPAWFAVFLAGFALQWAADSSAEKCMTLVQTIGVPGPQGDGQQPHPNGPKTIRSTGH